MAINTLLTISTLLAAGAYAQQAGTSTAETHPKLSIQKCTKSGCTKSQNSIVLDANWRWVHNVGGYTNCYTGQAWDATLCPDDKTCAANCAVDGADYSGTYGITTSNDALTLKLMQGSNIGSRVYLMDTDDTNYLMFKLNNQELSFDVDMSKLPCGLNGAVYFSQMDKDGGMAKNSGNKAGAKYGTGYCDSQCPKDLKFIAGQANVEGWGGSSSDANSGTGKYGTCCQEMDLWEANSQAAAVTPHPCNVEGAYRCTDGVDCTTVCDQAGCDFNSWRMGNQTFLGPGKTIDTNSKFTIVTQFINDASGTLTEIRRKYVQNGKVIDNSQSTIAGVSGNSITDSFCAAQKSVFGDTNTFAAMGGLKQMGTAFTTGAGMVLVLSIWDDHAANMLWLDSDYPVAGDATKPGVNRGPCATTSGVPKDVEANGASIQVTYSNIRYGDLDSTYSK